MKSAFKAAAAAATIGFALAGVALAQDTGLPPNFGEANLSAGFTPDPFSVTVVSGGSVDAAGIGCAGYISDAPDYRVNYVAGDYPLTFAVTSATDTTLVINTPSGQWACNDDQPDGDLNPLVGFASPESGQYDIWVGSFNADDGAEAELLVTEMAP